MFWFKISWKQIYQKLFKLISKLSENCLNILYSVKTIQTIFLKIVSTMCWFKICWQHFHLKQMLFRHIHFVLPMTAFSSTARACFCNCSCTTNFASFIEALLDQWYLFSSWVDGLGPGCAACVVIMFWSPRCSFWLQGFKCLTHCRRPQSCWLATVTSAWWTRCLLHGSMMTKIWPRQRCLQKIANVSRCLRFMSRSLLQAAHP